MKKLILILILFTGCVSDEIVYKAQMFDRIYQREIRYNIKMEFREDYILITYINPASGRPIKYKVIRMENPYLKEL